MDHPRLLARFALGPSVSRWRMWTALGIMALPVAFVWAHVAWLLAAVGVALVVSGSLLLVHWRRSRPRGHVVVHGWGFARADLTGKKTPLASFYEPFGVTVLASRAHRRAMLAITTPNQTRFVGVRLDGPNGDNLMLQASMLADGDALAAHAPDENALSAADALTLLHLVRDHAPQAQRRLFLSGSRGEQIVLDGVELRVDVEIFDLDSPLEWRGFLFHEALGSAASIYQATWIRQGTQELILVSPMPTDLLLTPRVQLLQSTSDEPPAPELRTGIERVFMLPLREALARAPRVSRNAPKRVSSPDLGA